MATFKRPGTIASSAFGISFEVDREGGGGRDGGGGAPPTASYNPYQRLSLTDQRARLPIAKHRREILWAVEAHATTVVVGETGSGKTTQARAAVGGVHVGVYMWAWGISGGWYG